MQNYYQYFTELNEIVPQLVKTWSADVGESVLPWNKKHIFRPTAHKIQPKSFITDLFYRGIYYKYFDILELIFEAFWTELQAFEKKI